MGKSSFIYRGYSKGYKNNKKHAQAQQRAGELLKRAGAQVYYEYPYPCTLDELGQRNYVLDVYAEIKTGKTVNRLCIEIDGASHESLSRQRKDKLRDNALSERGILTVRFNVEELVGRFALTDDEVLEKLEL